MANVFLTRMNAGIPGTVNRIVPAVIEAEIIDPTNVPATYGVPVAIDATSKKARGIIGADVAASIYGMLVKPYPSQENTTTPAFGTATPVGNALGDVLKSGYISVLLRGATASAKNGTVYVRIATPGTNKVIGGVEAASDSANTIIMANAYFTGPADANGNTEIAFNL